MYFIKLKLKIVKTRTVYTVYQNVYTVYNNHQFTKINESIPIINNEIIRIHKIQSTSLSFILA